MARNAPKLDSETSSTLETMRNAEAIEAKETPAVVETELVETESKAEPKTEIKIEPKPEEKTVPLAALHETREELKAERKRNEENQRKTEERLRMLQEVIQKPATQEQVIPDPERDALGALKLNQSQLKELQDFKKKYETEQQDNLRNQQLMTEAARLENEFVQKTPDYITASQYLSDSRRNELLATGIYAPHQVFEIIQQEARALAQQAISGGRNPAELVYAIAKARGYVLKAPEPPKVDASAAQNIERIAEGQAASKSLGQAQGAQASSGAKLDGKTLANMTDDEFNKLYNKLSRGERMALMGN